MGISSDVGKINNSQYIFTNRIAKNILEGNWGKFFGKHRIKSEYKNSEYYSKKDIVGFINEKIVEKKLKVDDINEFLPRQLTFGQHKCVYIYRFDSDFNNSKDGIIEVINEKYNIESLDYNELARTIYYNSEKEEQDIAYIKILEEKASKISRLRLIITKKVRYIENNKVTKKNESKFEQSYFPIDIDFEKNEIIIKSIKKDYINITDYKGHNVVKKIVQELSEMFLLNLKICKNSNQEALYKMSKDLLNDVIKEKGKSGLSELKGEISNLAKITQEKISSKLNIDIKNKDLSIENITEEITSVIENIVLPLMLIDTKTIDGLISYIKFRDKSAVNAVLKSKRRSDTLLDSDAYLNLRKSLNESRYVEKLRVLWNEDDTSLYYDANDEYSIELHFYKDLFEEDLINAINRFKEYR